ncbi:hypothetical protein ILUMI_08196 [Ignelater luminosus]|uniref:FAD dependent oxidoreductase domain-containing protein n=1 Tax=Ignelater luminosus TaxID=2038154 RepID=A0A8K0D226_IGNLU|nr:hypothetical protein ILUMI_08196 [Ignelater luminosus]
MYEIVVVGCGVIGLTTAVAIQGKFKKTCKVTIFTEKLSPHTTSDVAAGIWCPYLYQDTNMKNIVKWSKATYDYLINLWREGHADEAGICLQPLTMVFSNEGHEQPDWLNVPFGTQPLSTEHLETINKQHKKNFKTGIHFITISAEPLKLLPFLQKRFIQNGGAIKMKKIINFNELSNYDVIVNCTGLYSKILAKDDQVVPARGQLVRVKAQWNFQTFLHEDGDGAVIVNYDSTVLGGTCQVNDTNENPSDSDTRMILKKCYELVPAIQKAPLLDITVGLRPVRTRIRVEMETIKVDNKVLRIVHNYGHGGGGITLSYGCALEATELIKGILEDILKHKL